MVECNIDCIGWISTTIFSIIYSANKSNNFFISGDLEYKPYVSAEPDIRVIPLDGTEDFLILACDGLWDFVSEQEAVNAVYGQLSMSPG